MKKAFRVIRWFTCSDSVTLFGVAVTTCSMEASVQSSTLVLLPAVGKNKGGHVSCLIYHIVHVIFYNCVLLGMKFLRSNYTNVWIAVRLEADTCMKPCVLVIFVLRYFQQVPTNSKFSSTTSLRCSKAACA